MDYRNDQRHQTMKMVTAAATATGIGTAMDTATDTAVAATEAAAVSVLKKGARIDDACYLISQARPVPAKTISLEKEPERVSESVVGLGGVRDSTLRNYSALTEKSKPAHLTDLSRLSGRTCYAKQRLCPLQTISRSFSRRLS